MAKFLFSDPKFLQTYFYLYANVSVHCLFMQLILKGRRAAKVTLWLLMQIIIWEMMDGCALYGSLHSIKLHLFLRRLSCRNFNSQGGSGPQSQIVSTVCLQLVWVICGGGSTKWNNLQPATTLTSWRRGASITTRHHLLNWYGKKVSKQLLINTSIT